MEAIYPLHEDHISRFCGYLVCAVMKDGTRHIGVLSRCRNGELVLNEASPEHDGSYTGTTHTAKLKSGKKQKKGKPGVQTSAYPYGGYGYPGYGYSPYGYGGYGPPVLLDLALLAFLFLLI